METLTATLSRDADLATRASPGEGSLTVIVRYSLSEKGRKAALLAGLDGRARQTLAVTVPAGRLHLVSVDLRGRARLKLRPRYERDAMQRIVRIEDDPVYDAPPTLDELFALAAKNYELERVYHAARDAARAQRIEAERDLRARVAQTFLADVTERALPHPTPTPTRCYVLTERGRRLFDTATDEGVARELPPEAHRRFRADLRAKAERNRQVRAAQQALHEVKKEAIAVWIAAHGTADQQARQQAGVLPLPEAIEALTDHVFAALGDRPRYERDGAVLLQAHLRATSPTYADAVVTPADLVVTSAEATTASQAQWAFMQELRSEVPLATVTLRAHRLAWRRDPRAPTLTVFSVSVVQKEGVFTVRREFVAPL